MGLHTKEKLKGNKQNKTKEVKQLGLQGLNQQSCVSYLMLGNKSTQDVVTWHRHLLYSWFPLGRNRERHLMDSLTWELSCGCTHISAGATSSEGLAGAGGSTSKVDHSHGWQALSGYWLGDLGFSAGEPLHRAAWVSSWHGGWLSLEQVVTAGAVMPLI